MLIRPAVSILVTVMPHLLVFQGSSGNLSLSTVAVGLQKTRGLCICSLLSVLNITQTFLLSSLVSFPFLFLFLFPFGCTRHSLQPILCRVGKSKASKLVAISKAKTPPVRVIWMWTGSWYSSSLGELEDATPFSFLLRGCSPGLCFRWLANLLDFTMTFGNKSNESWSG